MRSSIILILLLVCGLAAAGCSSLSAEDTAFATQAQASLSELKPIPGDLGAALKAERYADVETLGTRLSTRATFWHDTLEPMTVTAKMADTKTALLLSLEEATLAGDGDAAAMRLYLDGKVSQATARLDEATPHMTKAAEYMRIAQEKMPK